MKKITTYLLLLSIAIVGFSCSKNGESNPPGTSRMVVRLGDAPGDYEKVIVDVQDVMINFSENESGWISLPNIKKGQYDLLKLTAGLDTLLVDAPIASGKVNQIRLILGSENFVQVDGQLLSMDTPSAQQSGLKIKINHEFLAGVTYRVLLDFDVSKSIVTTGSGKYILKPVIRAIVDAQGGGIAGIVNPPTVPTEVLAILGTDTVGTYTNAAGAFVIQGLTAGTYNVVLRPEVASGFNNKTVTGVVVVNGQSANLGTINF